MPLIILGIVVMLPLMMVIYSMSREYAGQISHVDEEIRCRSIALSVFSTVQARIREKPYSKRFFAPSAFREYVQKFQGGEYELFVIDTPGKPLQADIYITSTYKRVRRLFFWRILIENTILDAVGKVYNVIYGNLDPMAYGNGGPNSTADSYINQILQERKSNRKRAAEKTAMIKPQTSFVPIANILNIPDTGRIEDSPDIAADTIGVIPALPTPPAPPLETEIFSEDFESRPLGQHPPEWGYVMQVGQAAVTSDNVAGGQQAIRYYSAATNETIQSRININVGDDVTCIVAEYDVYVEKPVTSAGFSFYPISNNGIMLRGDDMTVSFVQSAGNFIPVAPFQAGRWYRIRMDIDIELGKTSIYVDGALKNANLPANSSRPTSFIMGNAHAYNGTTDNIVYFDNVTIRSGAPESPSP